MFHIRTRIVGTEPLDPATRSYNQTLRQRLGRWNVRLVEIERKKLGEQWINTRYVNHALARGDWRHVEAYVPPTTLAYLQALGAELGVWKATL
jgi:[citrate (pro-3S)-lyase] ligase